MTARAVALDCGGTTAEPNRSQGFDKEAREASLGDCFGQISNEAPRNEVRHAAKAANWRTNIMKHLLATTILGAVLGLPAAALAADYTIMAPAAPGGGWDQTARAMQEALTAEGVSGNVQVTNVPGAGGTIGLAQFVQEANGDPSKLIVGGYVMVGAILTN